PYARVALPLALVLVPLDSADAGNEARMRRIGDVPDFVRETAEGPQQIDRVGIALRQALAVADARHLRAALLGAAFRSRNVRKIFRPRRIGDVDDRGAVELALPAQRVHRLAHISFAMVAAIGGVELTLLVGGR